MVGSKLTLKAIFKAKKAKNRTSLEHPYFVCSNKVETVGCSNEVETIGCSNEVEIEFKMP